ncbi:hypothetical protein DI270_000445 [Microbispora triticiradicis]|uniref:Uncharacterized protein n=1 Tax=Microbispora triticiradicis TaxID=2200763 RepID=A0ABX9LSG5_9ACTN|nr:hypothetical protein [Microbispora triticiradicis]RGA06970.1 hypothetical protein DI270_000445 [Microbispora triticiradicis]
MDLYERRGRRPDEAAALSRAGEAPRAARRGAKAARRIAVALLGALALGAVTAVACASTGPAAAGDIPSAFGAPHPGQVELARLADRIDAALRRDFPRQYAGVALAPTGGGLIVYRRPSPALDAALRARFPKAPIKTRYAPHAARELDALAARVRRDIAYWGRRGVPITSVTARHDGTAVEVGTTSVARASAQLRRRYGSAPLRFVEARPSLILDGAH